MHPNLQVKNSPYSPSFNRFYNPNLAEVAARVTSEFPAADDDDAFSSNAENRSAEKREDLETVYEEEDEDDFEFNLPDLDLVLPDGEIRPVYPVFDRDLMRGFSLVGEIESRPSNQEAGESSNQLNNLFLGDRGGCDPPPPSSSDADDLDRIPAGTYCVWAPNKSPSPGRCMKSSSTGSSATEKLKLWKLRDLLKRSRSDGKDGGRRVMLLTPKKKAETVAAGRSSNSSPNRAGKAAAAREREKNKRQSYLPYKQGLVGFFVTPQALRKSYLPKMH